MERVKLSFERLCKERHIPHLVGEGHHHCRRGWIQLHCPFCGGGTSGWHLGYSIEGGYFHCWKCGGHSLYATLRKLLGETEAKRVLQNFGGRELVIPSKLKKEIVRKRELSPPPGTGPLMKPHRDYLASRGFDPDELVSEWGVQGTTYASGVWNWRIIIPIYDLTGRIVAYQGRALHPAASPRYRTTPDAEMLISPRHLLYGIHRARGDSVLIVEGVTGVWKLGPGTVAVLGIDWKKEQAAFLRHYTRRYVMFDPEPQAQKRAFELATWLSYYPGETEVVFPGPTDPGDFSPRKVRKIKEELRISGDV